MQSNVFPAEVLTASGTRYLKARVIAQDGQVEIRNKQGRLLTAIDVEESDYAQDGAWSVYPVVRWRLMPGCGCGGTQVL